VGVRDKDGVNILRVEALGPFIQVVLLLLTLKHPEIDEDRGIIGTHNVARTGDIIGGTVER
jgi:hypothetical protein